MNSAGIKGLNKVRTHKNPVMLSTVCTFKCIFKTTHFLDLTTIYII